MCDTIARAVVENELSNPIDTPHKCNLIVYDVFIIHLKNRKRCVVDLNTLIHIAQSSSQHGNCIDICVNDDIHSIMIEFPLKLQVGNDEYCYMYHECDHIVISTIEMDDAVETYRNGGINAENIIPICVPSHVCKNNILELIYYHLAKKYAGSDHAACLSMVKNRIITEHNLPTGTLAGNIVLPKRIFDAGSQQSTVT